MQNTMAVSGGGVAAWMVMGIDNQLNACMLGGKKLKNGKGKKRENCIKNGLKGPKSVSF